ncbi:MAG: Phospho-N-acetylmuramoyl-pentapeptide-transferase, partial [uncultured Nocardioidaceae bacterium]
ESHPPSRRAGLAGNLARHTGSDPAARATGLRAADPRRRADLAPHQARHPHHGRRGADPVHSDGVRPGQSADADHAVRLGTPPALLVRGARRRRLPRRLHQGLQAAQPGSAQQGQDGRPDSDRADLRLPGAAVPRRERRQSDVRRDLLHPRDRRVGASHGARAPAGAGHGGRGEQRREPHRRPGRSGHGLVGDGFRCVRLDQHLAEQPVVHTRRLPQVLRRTRPPRPRGRGRCHHRLRLRLPVVERRAREDLHGRHRVPLPGRCHGRPRRAHPDRAAPPDHRGAVRHHHLVGDPPGRLVQAERRLPAVPDGSVAAPLRAQRLGRGHHRDQVLDHLRHLRRRGDGCVLRGVGGRRV